ncbi:MAG: hypothetical protein AB8G15_10460 [Saprospiraceae bacterium]
MLDVEYFYLLKKRLLEKYRVAHPHWNKPLHEFKGREIANFQDQLQEEVQGRISEKWFYTHLKPVENTKLPRIDILDMLSQFVGYLHWEDFVQAHASSVSVESQDSLERAPILEKQTTPATRTWLFSIFFLAVCVLLWSQWSTAKTYHFCFINADTQQAITERAIKITVLNDGESPRHYRADSLGCFEFATTETQVNFVVTADYYYQDTIQRVLKNKLRTERIPLRQDDYALMIHLFSTAKWKDWNKQRVRLKQLIAAEAIIFQVAADGSTGMEMYNREEFIDKMSLPLSSLKNIRILKTQYQNGKIISLRFMQNKLTE